MQQHRRLAAILFTDIVGFTSIMQQNEEIAVAQVKHYQSVLKKIIKETGGKILNNYGDGNLCVFGSATEALQAAILLQKQLHDEPSVPLRIGLHIGEIRTDEDNVFGDGVNLASRIQSIGNEHAILFSAEFFQQIKNHPEFTAKPVGTFEFKNVEQPVMVYALANEGFTVPEQHSLNGKLKTPKPARRSAVAIISGLIVLLIAGLLFWKYYFNKDEGKLTETTIAILPFQNLSINKEENEPFCIGIGLELQKRLEWIGGLTTISAQSVEKYRDSKMQVQAISRELGGVQYLVTGTVQRTGNRVKVFVTLIDASTGKQVWNEAYPGEVVDIFSLQDNIASQIATTLKVTITPGEKKKLKTMPTSNMDALEQYHKALSHYVKLAYAFHPSWPAQISVNTALYYDYQNTLALCNRALQLDSGMTDALLLKAKTMYFRHRYFTSNTAVADSIRSICRKALLLRPQSQEAYVILSQLQPAGSTLKPDPVTGLMPLQMLEKAYQLNPNNFEVNWELGNYYAMKDPDPEKSIRHFKKALHIDPMSVWTAKVFVDFAGPYWNVQEYTIAEFYLKKAIEISNNSSTSGEAMMHLCIIYLQNRQPDSVFRYAGQLLAQGDKNALYYMAEAHCVMQNNCQKACELYSEVWNSFPERIKESRWGYALWKTGKKEEGLKHMNKGLEVFRKLDSLGIQEYYNYDVAGIYSFLGQKEKSLEVLKKMDQRKGWNMGMLNLVKTDPLFDNIRNEPAFKEIISTETEKRMRLREKIRQQEAEGSL